jgi:DNA polymerase
MLRIREEGYWILFHVHDEVIVEVEDERAEQALEDVTRILSTPPEWIPDIPLEAEGKILQRYEK